MGHGEDTHVQCELDQEGSCLVRPRLGACTQLASSPAVEDPESTVSYVSWGYR